MNPLPIPVQTNPATSKRLFWPAPFRDELLARLIKLNEDRAAAEKAAN